MTETRNPITFLLPPRIAVAILEAAQAAGRLDGQGQVIMDHMIFASASDLLKAATVSNNDVSEGGFKGV